ncbi:MAG: hypothetical protein HYY91_03550 [Candidatus Omnitrophica bacterium]|nr:hypothetical protein [Candidatus Omnitrophota bacterium]
MSYLEMLSETTIEQLSRRFSEPAWLSQLRASAWQRHAELPWPHPSDEIWRRTDVSMFDPGRPAARPASSSQILRPPPGRMRTSSGRCWNPTA